MLLGQLHIWEITMVSLVQKWIQILPLRVYVHVRILWISIMSSLLDYCDIFSVANIVETILKIKFSLIQKCFLE